MIKYVLILFAVLVASVSHAEVDTRARAAIDDIRLGKNNANAIQNLYVRDTISLPAGSIEAALSGYTTNELSLAGTGTNIFKLAISKGLITGITR